MVQNGAPARLQQQWIRFLELRSHHVEVVKDATGVLVSRDGKGKPYRWVLFVATGVIKTLRREERIRLRTQIRRAQEAGQEAFVVVRFTVPQAKLVIKPAEAVLQTSKVGSARGGIDWPA